MSRVAVVRGNSVLMTHCIVQELARGEGYREEVFAMLPQLVYLDSEDRSVARCSFSPTRFTPD